ncbi:GMC family oxidoreductase N-terminal domain-containing protein [Siccirubricoccus sp. KC 17139]|uniref:GMC family oxidoreductase N-terminal domain-containing protein n=1 Tax=Siccirubricoccus soli TaxID=2899147 RepID=A0ABT1CZE2_9PROT|nr:GMC family oxidoreductase N-terminal domain-containing protein [Siccirubricoccus soli]MCO6415031.1 GMC family oxidoreductase N-terminal domain-containing protein [Siccirubricoccus soli]MCP2681162.1 GMC family oxidoreductase N-terminal domain-containing protein [Siccirubricoccus soli]
MATEHPGADSFDYVIVGSGAAGSVLANRLTEDGTATVCVLEAGPPDRNPWIHIPAGFIKTLVDPGVTWQFKTEPLEMTGGRRISTVQGRTLGGSSSVNGMIYNRGQPADLDNWAQRGNRGWGYEDCLPYYRRSENRMGICDEAKRGREEDGIPVTDNDWINQVSEAFIAGCMGLGIPRNPDYNSGDQAGVGYFQRAIRRGMRVSAARAFLHPAMRRPNLEVRTDARASAILLEGKRAVGVQYLHARGAAPKTVLARREVILSAGTVNTARLLQVSGIGPADLLGRLGVPVRHELRGVGANFRDHYASRFVMRAKPGVVTLNQLARGVRLAQEVWRWSRGKPSILATSPSHVHVFWKSFEGLDMPDLQCVFTPGSYAEGKVYVLDDYPGVTAGAWQHRPESHGWVRARSTDVFEDPEINPNYLSDPMDRQVHLGGMRLLRRMLNTPELAPYLETETLPGPQVQSDDELLDFARRNGSTTYHLIGTARMGPASDPSAVVDDRLRVHGLQGLRVVDASIMPSMPSANTYATTLMIAEKAADFIRGRQAMPAEAA